MEKIIGRNLNDMTKWNAVIKGSMSFFAFLAASAYFFAFIKKGNECFRSILAKFKEVFTSKNSLRYLGIIFGFIFISYLTILMAHYDFQDDIKRIISGHKSWVGASRYISEALSVIFHANFYLNDIAPLTQIIAILVLTLTSFILAYILTDGKITWLTAIASTFIGLCPHFVQNMSFKFDSPYMAMALLFSVIPFLFVENPFNFCVTSFLCINLLCSSYQAANSIFIVLVIFTAFRKFNEAENLGKNEISEIVKFIGLSILLYIVSMAFFKLFIMIPTEATINERNTKLVFDELFSLMKDNWISYSKKVIKDYGNIWIKFFTIVSSILFIIFGTINSKRNKIYSFLLTVFTLSFMFFLSFGAYLVIGNVIIKPRAFMGFDALIALIGLFVSNSVVNLKTERKLSKIFSTACILAWAWGLCINSTVTGNVYMKQQKYQDFRFTLLLSDLSKLIDQKEHNECLVYGDIGPVTSSNMDWKNYDFAFGDVNAGWTSYIIQDWNMDLDFISIESYSFLFMYKPQLKERIKDLPILCDTYYHSIYGKDNFYYVVLKNPQVEKYEIK